MVSFYKQRFTNAADFTLAMAGAFKVDDVLPLLARYVGGLPSTGQQTSRVVDLGIHFPEATQRVSVEKGREPRAQTVISFFADPPPTPLEQEHVIAATTVLDIALRDALREELGQTYTVGVGLSQPLPQRGAGRIQVQFGAAPENVGAMTDRVLAEVKRLQENGPTADLTNRAKESARWYLRNVASRKRLLAPPDEHDSYDRRRSRRHHHAQRAHRLHHTGGTPGGLQEELPDGSVHDGDADAGGGEIGLRLRAHGSGLRGRPSKFPTGGT